MAAGSQKAFSRWMETGACVWTEGKEAVFGAERPKPLEMGEAD